MSLLCPFRKSSSIRNASPCSSPPSFRTRLRGGGCRAAGRQHVVDDQDALAVLDGVFMDLQRIGAVFQLVGLLQLLAGSLPGLRIGMNPAPSRSATALRG